MTPDLKRALKASWASDEPSLSWDEANAELQASYAISTAAALRSLRDPSPEVLEAMAVAIQRPGDMEQGRPIFEAMALAAWCAGIDAILSVRGGAS